MTTHDTVDELALLRPLPTDAHDEDQWPIFVLKDARVYTRDSGELRPVEMWRAETAWPVTIEGTLVRLPRAQQKYYSSTDVSTHQAAIVRISGCVHWSYGQYDDGTITFWAAGRAGWYELKPSSWYRATHRQMKQGFDILYFAADFYRELVRKTGSGAAKRRASLQQTAVDSLMREYASLSRYKFVGHRQDVGDFFLRHAELLTTMMKRGKEEAGWSWDETPLFTWLNDQMKIPSSDLSLEPRSADEGDDSISSLGHVRLSGKGRASLRPKLAPAKGIYSGRTRSFSKASDDDSSEMQTDGPMLRSSKRRASQVDGSDRQQRASKRLAAARAVSPSSLNRPASTDGLHDDAVASLPIRANHTSKGPRPAQQRQEPALKLVSATLPSYEATPGTDIWHCPFDGCSARYYGVSSQPGVTEMIRQHYVGHAMESQRQLDLVMQEERPYLPVGNLVRHIRSMVAADTKRQSDQGDLKSRTGTGTGTGTEPGLGVNQGRTIKPIVQRY